MDFLIDLSITFDGFWTTENVLASMFFLEFIACGAYVGFGCFGKEAKSESTVAAILGKSSGNHALLSF